MLPTKKEMQQYLQRFTGTIPLVVYPLDPYLDKCMPYLVESEINLRCGLYSISNLDSNKKYKIIAGFKKAQLRDFIHYDYLINSDIMPNFFHKAAVKKITALCPNDFIALPVTLINLSNKVESYKNKDFYIINALHTLDAIDREKSVIDVYPSGREVVDKRVYKEDPWQGHLLVFEKNIRKMIWHPKLAKALYPGKKFQFATPEENSYWKGRYIPEPYDKASWFEYLSLKNKMANPSPRLAKAVNLPELLKEIE